MSPGRIRTSCIAHLVKILASGIFGQGRTLPALCTTPHGLLASLASFPFSSPFLSPVLQGCDAPPLNFGPLSIHQSSSILSSFIPL